ncbi:MAG: right-handed parallel beta-helix repeat-containing protein [Candidatus Krumholzibacteriia bacterium]
MRTVCIALLILLAICTLASAREIVVPDSYPTIGQAIAAANAGDVIQLRRGRFAEANLDLVDGITIRGNVSDPAAYVIDGGGVSRIFRAESVANVRLVGLTITGGHAAGPTSYSASGGGIFVSRSSVVLERVIFTGNRADYSGGGVRAAYSVIDIADCEFRDCTAVKGGGAIDLSYDCEANAERTRFVGNRAAWGGAISARTGSSCLIDACDFTSNTAVPPQELGGGFFADHAARVTFRSCVFAGNSARQGGAVRLADAVSGFGNCTLSGNSAWESGAGFMTRDGSLVIDHTIISFNDGEAVNVDGGSIWITDSDLHGNLGGDWTGPLRDLRYQHGNLDADPEFCDAGVYEISVGSPCAAANNERGQIGARGVGCDEVGMMLQAFTAEARLSEVIITWTVSNDADHEFRLTGRALNDPSLPAWNVPFAAAGGAGRYLATDKPAVDSYPVLYRLESRTLDGDWLALGEETVQRPLSPADPLSIDSVFPNPFNPQVTIAFTLARDADVTAAVYDLQGRRVRTVYRGALSAGSHEVHWDSRDDQGRVRATGTYLLRIEGGGPVYTRKLLLVK